MSHYYLRAAVTADFSRLKTPRRIPSPQKERIAQVHPARSRSTRTLEKYLVRQQGLGDGFLTMLDR
jgi:hypothetical protein